MSTRTAAASPASLLAAPEIVGVGVVTCEPLAGWTIVSGVAAGAAEDRISADPETEMTVAARKPHRLMNA